MQTGIFAKTFSGNDPDTVLAAARAAGFGAVQYNMACSGIGALPLSIDPGLASAVGAAARRNKIEIAAVSATYNMIHPSSHAQEAGRQALEAIAAAASAIGTKVLTLCTGSLDPVEQWKHHPENGSPQSWRQLLLEFERIIPIAERYNVVLGVEPELGNVISNTARARTLLDTLRSDRVRIVLDPANLFEIEDDTGRRRIIDEAIESLGEAIVMAHAKDRRADGSFAPAGAGVIDFDHFCGALARAGFDGALVAHGLEATESRAVAQFLRDRISAAEPVG